MSADYQPASDEGVYTPEPGKKSAGGADEPSSDSEEVRGSADAGNKPRKKRSALAGNILLVICSTLAAAGALEGAMRLFPQLQVQDGDGDYVFCTAIQNRHVPNVRYGHAEIPGNSYFERFSPLDPWDYIHINEEGFRSNYRNGGQPVIVIGDSLARGSLVNESETFNNLLSRWHPQLDFRNYGIGGYGQANELRVYEDAGRKYPHRLVIVQFSLSTDIDDNVERAKLSGNGAEIKIKPAIGTPKTDRTAIVRLHNYIWAHSKLYPWIYTVFLKPVFSHWDARRDMKDALELTRRLLVKIDTEARHNNARVVVLAIPSWAEMAGHDDGMEPERQRKMLRALAAADPNISLIDMAPALRRESPDRTYGVIDKHLTAYGHFLVARTIDQWLSQNPINGTVANAAERRFAPVPPIVPDCHKAGEYLTRIKQGRSET